MATSSEVKYGEDLDAANLQLAYLEKLIEVANVSNSKSKLVSIAQDVEILSKNAQKYTKGICRATLPTLKIVANMAKTIADDNFEELSLKDANKLMASLIDKAVLAQAQLAVRREEVKTLVANSRNAKDVKVKKEPTAQEVFKDFKDLPTSVIEGSGDQLVTTDSAGRYNKYADLNMGRAAKLLTDLGPTLLKDELLINQNCVVSKANIIVSTVPGLTEAEATKLIDDIRPVYSGFWVFKDQLVIGVSRIDENTPKIISQEINAINATAPNKYYFSTHDMVFLKLKGNPLNWLWVQLKDTKLKMSGKYRIDYCGFVTGESIYVIKGPNIGNNVELKMKELMLNPVINGLYKENISGLRTLALRELRKEELEKQRTIVRLNKTNIQEKIAENDLMKRLITRQNMVQQAYSKKLEMALTNLNEIALQLKMPKKELSLIMDKGLQFFQALAATRIWNVARDEATTKISNLNERKAKFAEISLQERELLKKASNYIETAQELSELKDRLNKLKAKIIFHNNKMIGKYKKELGHLHG